MSQPTLRAYHALLGQHLPAELITACYESILHNDAAHNVDHIYRVCDYGLKITADILGEKETSMVMAGCLMHDLGCRYDRDTHHQISFGLAFEKLEQYAPGFFSPSEVMLVAKSCLEHRASWKEVRSHELCDFVAVADRGPLDLEEFIMRCIKFRAPDAKNEVTLKQDVFDHLREKCSRDGYMWKTYPTLGYRLNQFTIEKIIERVENSGWLTLAINETYRLYLDSLEHQHA